MLGEGSAEEQARRLFKRALEQAMKRRGRSAARTLVNGVARIIEDALRRRML
jgi:hypothetical protein